MTDQERDQECRVVAALGLIVRDEMTVDQIQLAIAQTRQSNPTEEETLGALAAAEAALKTIEVLAPAANGGTQ